MEHDSYAESLNKRLMSSRGLLLGISAVLLFVGSNERSSDAEKTKNELYQSSQCTQQLTKDAKDCNYASVSKIDNLESRVQRERNESVFLLAFSALAITGLVKHAGFGAYYDSHPNPRPSFQNKKSVV